MTNNNIDNMMKDIFAKVEGKKTSQIKIENITKKTRKKKSKNNVLKTNEEGVVLTGSNLPDFIEYNKIKGGRNYERKEHTEDWNNRDFVYYILDIYQNKFKKSLEINIPPACQEVARVHDALIDSLGFCDNYVLKDYFTFFINIRIAQLIRIKRRFYLSMFREIHSLSRFCNNYNYKNRIKETLKKEEKKSKIITLKNEIEKEYLLSEENLVYNYGIIIAINWLILCKGQDKRDVIKRVHDICIKAVKKENFDIIKNATQQYSPYPLWFVFQRLDLLLTKIDKNIEINIHFLDSIEINKKFNFSKRNENG